MFNQGEVDSLVADVVDFKGVAADRLCLGEKVTVWREDSYVAVGHAGRSGPPDEVLQTGAAVPIFSSTLRIALERAGIGGIQYLPLKVIDGANVREFNAANILTRVAALDEEASDLRRFPSDYFIESRRGQVSALRTPVLRDMNMLNDIHIFRLAEFWPPVFVSERFRDIFRLGGFTGLDFSEVAVAGSPPRRACAEIVTHLRVALWL